MALDPFRWASTTSIALKSGELDPADGWKDAKTRIKKLLHRGSDTHCTQAVRAALGQLIALISDKTEDISNETALYTMLSQYLDTKTMQKYVASRVMAVSLLGSLCVAEKDSLRGISANVFLVLSDQLKYMPTHAPIAFKVAVLRGIEAAVAKHGPSGLDTAVLKSTWKYTRQFAADPSDLVSEAVFDLLAEMVVPSLLKTSAKYDKLVSLCMKAFQRTPAIRHKAARCLACALQTSDLPVAQQIATRVAEYPQVNLRAATGIIEFFAQCLIQLGPQAVLSELSTFTSLFTHFFSPKLDQFRIKCAFRHVYYLVVEIVAKRILTSEMHTIALIRNIVTKLATTDKHHQLLSACMVPCLSSVVELAGPILPAQLSQEIYQLSLTLFDMSSTLVFKLEIIDFIAKFLNVSPHHGFDYGEHVLESLKQDKVSYEYAYLLGAIVNKPGLVALHPDIVTLAMELVRQKNQKFDLDKYKAGWALFTGFMTVQSDLVRYVLPNMLLLWGSALHVPSQTLGGNDLRFQFEVWKPALDSMLVFVQMDSITPDVARKLGQMILGLWNYTNALPSVAFTQDPLLGEDVEVIRRLLACYCSINFHGLTQFYPASLLTNSLKYVIGNPIKEGKEDLLESRAELGYGVCSLVLNGSESNDNLIRLPYLKSFENNPVGVITHTRAPPPSVDLIDKAVLVIAKVLPQQILKVQESLLDAIRTHIENKTPTKKSEAVLVNLNKVIAGLLTTTFPMYDEPRILRIFEAILQLFLGLKLPVGPAPADLYASLIKIPAAQKLASSYAKSFCDQIISNSQDFVLRANCARSIGAVIPAAIGASHDSLEILLQLSKDPYPLVHQAAIDGAIATISSPGILSGGNAAKFLDHLTELFVLDSHGTEMPVVKYSNMEAASSTFICLSRNISQVVSLLGPALQVEDSLFDSIHGLLNQLGDLHSTVSTPETVANTWECYQELFYYASERINWALIIKDWRNCVIESRYPFPVYYHAAVSGLLLFANKDSQKLIDSSSKNAEVDLWNAYDQQPGSSLKQILQVWAEQTIGTEPLKWLVRLHQVIMKPKADQSQESVEESNLEAADEDESLGPKAEKANNELYKWRTRLLALEVLKLLTVDQLHDKTPAARQNSLVTRNVGEIIKIAFNTSTSSVLALQLAGLEQLDLVIKYLADLVDPDFPEVSLLEQYQAQISSALTSSFGADSTAERAAATLDVCGRFIGSAIVKSTEKLGKIMRILTDSLHSTGFQLGQLQLHPFEAAMIKICVLKFWAFLETNSKHTQAIKDILTTQEPSLVPLWIEALNEHAKLEFKPEGQATTTFFADSVDKLRKQERSLFLKPVYESSWLEMVSALATLIEENGSESLNQYVRNDDYLFGLVGLCFADLLSHHRHKVYDILVAMRQILLPSVSASLIYDEDIFNEVVEALDRIALTGTAAEKALVVEIARNLANSHTESDFSVDHLFELFKTCAFPLKEIFPVLRGTEDQLPVNDSAENLRLIKLTLDSLIDIVPVFRQVIQNDQFVCLVHIFETIFVREDCQTKVVPHIFSCFKRLMEVMSLSYQNGTEETKQFIEQTICSSFVWASDALMGAENPMFRANFTLTCMVILCTNAQLLGSVLGNVARIGRVFAHDLNKISVQSIKSIFKTVKGPALHAFSYGCAPDLVELVTTDPTDDTCKNVCNLLVEYCNSDPKGMIFTVPVLLRVLRNEKWLTEERRHLYIRALVLNLIQHHAAEFKSVLHSLSAKDRQTLQELLVEEETDNLENDEEEVEIALTTFS